MKSRCSLPHSQEPAICQCPEPINPFPVPHPVSLRFTFILFSESSQCLPNGLSPSGFPHPHPLVSPTHLTVLKAPTASFFLQFRTNRSQNSPNGDTVCSVPSSLSEAVSAGSPSASASQPSPSSSSKRGGGGLSSYPHRWRKAFAPPSRRTRGKSTKSASPICDRHSSG